jgi:hypothetical protein
MSLPESLLGLTSRIAEVIGSYPWEFVLGVFALGLIAPAGVRRLVRGAAAVAFWMAVVVYLLPVGPSGSS